MPEFSTIALVSLPLHKFGRLPSCYYWSREIKKYVVRVTSNSKEFIKVYLEIDQVVQTLREVTHRQTDRQHGVLISLFSSPRKESRLKIDYDNLYPDNSALYSTLQAESGALMPCAPHCEEKTIISRECWRRDEFLSSSRNIPNSILSTTTQTNPSSIHSYRHNKLPDLVFLR